MDSNSKIHCIPSLPNSQPANRRIRSKVPWVAQQIPRVGINRLTNHPDERYFHFTQIHYDASTSLFFLADLRDETLWKRFKAVWRFLGDEGLGGDRSVGKGLFELPTFEEITLNTPHDHNARMVLSLFYPAVDEAKLLDGAWYELIDRKGYVFSPDVQSLKRQGVRLFSEGSVFRVKDRLKGKLVDVTPEIFKRHKVYRSGVALCVPCRDNGGQHAV